LPVLAVTAHPGHKLRALPGGAKDFISKPFDLAEVLMRVHNMLEVRLVAGSKRDCGSRFIPAGILAKLGCFDFLNRLSTPLDQ
jgi:DNA-binding response OmpR family regulator